MSFEQLVQLLREFGFPAAVAAFVLVRLDKRLAEITRALQKILMQLALNGGREP